MARNSKDLLNYLFVESQADEDSPNGRDDVNAGKDVDVDLEELEKSLEGSEEFQPVTTELLKPFEKDLIAALKKIGIEKPEDRIKNLGTHFILFTQDEYTHKDDLSKVLDLTTAEPLYSEGFIPLNGESDHDDNGLARFHIVIIK